MAETKVYSFTLPPETKRLLEQLAKQASREQGYRVTMSGWLNKIILEQANRLPAKQ